MSAIPVLQPAPAVMPPRRLLDQVPHTTGDVTDARKGSRKRFHAYTLTPTVTLNRLETYVSRFCRTGSPALRAASLREVIGAADYNLMPSRFFSWSKK